MGRQGPVGRAGGAVIDVDRGEAIRSALAMARAGDVVLIAGKGHETGQDFGDYVEPFDDVEVARRALSRRRPGPVPGGAPMKALLIAGGVALLVAMLGTPLLIGQLRARGIGQQIREDGPAGHFSKAGTPTMGGLAIMGAAVVGYIVAHVSATFTTRGLVGMLTICAAALVGFLDDWLKVTRQRSLGLNKRAKIVGQLVVALAFAIVAVDLAESRHPSFVHPLQLAGLATGQGGLGHLGRPDHRGLTNAVNLTDGLDGLAAGSSAFTFAAFTVIGFYQLRHEVMYRNPASLDEAVMAAALIGACAGFLWWNAAPARIFMGDTGSLGIGAAVAVLALLENVDLLLPHHRRPVRPGNPLGDRPGGQLTGCSAAGSSAWPRYTTTSSLLGWPETTVIVRFWILAGLFTALSLGVFLRRLPGPRRYGMTGGPYDRRPGRKALVIGYGAQRACRHAWLAGQG